MFPGGPSLGRIQHIMEHFLAILMGVGLAASCGFRVFVPMLIAGLAAWGGYLEPSEGFAWIGSPVALVAFAAATVFEITAFYIPWLDNLLDAVASPAAVVAGILLSAAMMGDVSPVFQWSLAIIAGGGAAAAVQAGAVATRLTSTASSGGMGNFLVATLETAASVIFSLLSVVVPVLAVLLLALAVAAMYWTSRAVLRRLRSRCCQPAE